MVSADCDTPMLRDASIQDSLSSFPLTLMVASHFCKLVLIAPKPKPIGYPKEINTLGDHIRRGRMDRGLLIKDVAAQIGVTDAMICLWETHRAVPVVSQMPAIIRFLGF